jgi:hypothetical protein
MSTLDARTLYRLPWSVPDNVIAWLEPTKQCNIHCDGCYSQNQAGSHKTLEQIRSDLDVFARYRRAEAVSIAGGDPLTHPRIVDVVGLVAERGLKPVVNTNGFALTPGLLRRMKDAGLRGITFHIDSRQKRPGWTGKDEVQLNALRQECADMVASVGGLSCAFNATVYESTLDAAPEILDWARRNPSKVHVVVFIAFRSTVENGRFDYYVGADRVDTGELVYAGGRPERTDLSTREIVAALQKRFPRFQPAAFLNGTETPDALKWLMTLLVNDGKDYVGSLGPRMVELAQVVNHLVTGKYLGYAGPGVMRSLKMLLPLAAIDPGLRAAARQWLSGVARDPMQLARPLYVQSVMIIQPVDVLADGRASMCDGCPDLTVHDGELVWSCRLEERLRYGQWMRPIPRKQPTNGEGVAKAEAHPSR